MASRSGCGELLLAWQGRHEEDSHEGKILTHMWQCPDTHQLTKKRDSAVCVMLHILCTNTQTWAYCTTCNLKLQDLVLFTHGDVHCCLLLEAVHYARPLAPMV